MRRTLKNFSEFLNEGTDSDQLVTLRDVIDNDNFDHDDPGQYPDFLEAALWTADHFGLGAPPEAEELMRLGLTDHAQLLASLSLENIVEVFNSTGTIWNDIQRFRALVKKYPSLFTMDNQNDLELAVTADLIQEEELDHLVISAWSDPVSGTVAVKWVSDYHVEILMLRTSVQDLLK